MTSNLARSRAVAGTVDAVLGAGFVLLATAAPDALGDVVFVQSPDVGAEFGAGDTFGEVESTKSVSEVYAPVQGVVVEVNGDLEVSPELVNSDPYGAGWLIVVEPVDLRSVETLLDADAYRKLTEA